jgi:DNA-binding beta-propeller fold protein YncE
MTEAQRHTIGEMLAWADDGHAFVGADIRPANEADSIYGIAVNPDGADVYVAITTVEDGEEHTGVSVIDPVGDVVINYEPN